MIREDVLKLYIKERDYQRSLFGEYRDHPDFNVATFLLFIERYLQKAKKDYSDVWTSDLPPWLMRCHENKVRQQAPVKTYEALIEIFALTGAALETYTEINPDLWREEGVKPKWKE